MELKQIQAKYLESWKGDKFNPDWQAMTNWDQENLATKSPDQLLTLKGRFYIKGQQKEAFIRDVANEAKAQLMNYMKLENEKNLDKRIHGYVIIRVGLSAIIHEHIIPPQII